LARGGEDEGVRRWAFEDGAETRMAAIKKEPWGSLRK
jgi:hypothetical protein